jgi:uncharacterized protein (UPF0332 family)
LTPESVLFLAKARRCLEDAGVMLQAGLPGHAGREACLVAFHAAQALIFERTGAVAKTHKGVHTQFALLTRDQIGIGPVLRRFLSESYDLKSRSDYDVEPEALILPETAREAIEAARQFVAAVAQMIAPTTISEP